MSSHKAIEVELSQKYALRPELSEINLEQVANRSNVGTTEGLEPLYSPVEVHAVVLARHFAGFVALDDHDIRCFTRARVSGAAPFPCKSNLLRPVVQFHMVPTDEPISDFAILVIFENEIKARLKIGQPGIVSLRKPFQNLIAGLVHLDALLETARLRCHTRVRLRPCLSEIQIPFTVALGSRRCPYISPLSIQLPSESKERLSHTVALSTDGIDVNGENGYFSVRGAPWMASFV